MQSITDGLFILSMGVACGFAISLGMSLIGHGMRSILDWMKGG
jgi:hypothetical protein